MANNWSLSKWLITKKQEKNNIIPGQLLCCQCKAKFLLKTEIDWIDDEVQSVTDTDDDFTECQTPRKKLQSVSMSTVLNAKHQGKSSSQLACQLSVYTQYLSTAQ